MGTFKLTLDPLSLEAFVPVAAAFGTERYGYVVTPNSDHVVRLDDSPALRPLYEDATFCLLDSRFMANLIRWSQGHAPPVCVGSDLTAELFNHVIAPQDRIVLIGGSVEQTQILARKYGLQNVVHHNPPMGFIRDPAAVEACLAFIEAHSPFRYCFLGVGSPQQEKVAHQLLTRRRARGLALCIGASINFLTGGEKRAPMFLQRMGLEWIYRLMHDPRRMWRRYLLRGPRAVILALTGQFVLRER